MKGVSALLSAVFLILITVVIAAFISGWLTGLSQEQASDIANTTTERLGCQFADMYINNATYNCNSNCSAGIAHTLELFITNSGKKKLYISNLVIQNTTGDIYTYNLNITTNLSVGEIIYLKNVSATTCNGINGSLDKVIVTSINCPSNAFDSIVSSDITYVNC